MDIIPNRFRTLSLECLLKNNGELLSKLCKTYQEIFGDPNIWNEGAFCGSEGWTTTISLQEYTNRKAEGRLRCECGGIFQPCYPKEVLEVRVIDELSDPRSILIVMEGDDEFRIGGFLWGIVCDFDEIKRRILNARYAGRGNGSIELNKLSFRLKERGLLDGKFLYGDEMGVLKRFRGGVKYLAYLFRIWAEHGSRDTNKLLFWTSRKSPLYLIGTSIGCEPIHATKDGVEFLVHTDFGNILRTIQNSPISVKKMLRLTRRIKESG